MRTMLEEVGVVVEIIDTRLGKQRDVGPGGRVMKRVIAMPLL